jgi:glycosyltransferase involved in cell wall biosynthesis
MKVMHISTAKSWRGGEQQLAYLYEELQLQNIEQLIICPAESALSKTCAAKNYRHENLTKQWSFDFFYAAKLVAIATKFQAIIIHTHDAHAHTLALMVKTFFGLKVKLIVSRRVDFPVANNILSSWKYNSPHVSKIICVSEVIKNIMLKSVPENKLAVVHSGIDCEKFKAPSNVLRNEFNIAANTLIIANVAALAPHKDYFTFLNTVKILKETHALHAKYFIVGDGELKQPIENKITELELQNDIILTGFRHDITHFFAEIDILLFTSETEGLGTTVLDAFCCGVPVAATNAGGVAELVTHEKTGMISEIKNAKVMAENVMKLINNTPLKQQIITEAKLKSQQFSKAAMAKKTWEIYKQPL